MGSERRNRRIAGIAGWMLGALLAAAWPCGAQGPPDAQPMPVWVAARSAERPGAHLTAVAGPGEIEVTWARPAGRDVLYYLVYRGEARDPELAGEPFEMVKGLRFVDSQVVPGIEYRYAVVPVERGGARCPATAVASARAAGAAGPRIAGVAVEPAGRSLRVGDVLTVTVTGPSGCRATADLGGLVSDLPLREKGRSGRYVGTYPLRPKDLGARPAAYRLVVHLADASGSSDLAGPELPVVARGEPQDKAAPVIAKASHDGWKVAGFSGKLVAGDVLTVTAEGEPGAEGRFELAGLTGALPLREIRPGVYAGSYTVRWTDRVGETRVLVRLSDAAGNESAAQAGRPVAFDTRVRLTVTARDPILPADGRSETRLVAHAANANGDEVSGHEIGLTLQGRDEPVRVGGGRDAEGSAVLKWGGVTDAFGDVVGTFTASRTAGNFLVLAKDLTTGDVGVGWVATGERPVPAAPRSARVSRGIVSRPGSGSTSPSGGAPSPAELREAFGTFFVPRLFDGQERDRVRVAEWLVEPGERVQRGQALVALETSRGTVKIGAPAKGVLLRRSRAERDRVALGDVLGAVEIDPEVWKVEFAK